MKKLTEEERAALEEQKREERIRKRRARLEKHAVDCPHCGKSVLDHMTKCPYCEGGLTPRGYRPVDEAKMKKIKSVAFIVGLVIAAAVIITVFALRG
ncbi:MAG: hypothetical protein K2N84_04315 [Clostridia bacterium]|nr:hypothetical protein [Clostridia bacterium]